jgi:biopolymer transport protein ExbD
MLSRRSILNRRKRKKIHQSFNLQLTSMMDILIIIVIFLLKSYHSEISSFNSTSKIKLPFSISQTIPPESLQVIVTPEAMTLENERILDFLSNKNQEANAQLNYEFKSSDLDETGKRIIPLYDALMKERHKTELLLAHSKAQMEGRPLPFEGILAIQADKQIKYETLRKMMYTSAAAGFKVFRFLAMKREL